MIYVDYNYGLNDTFIGLAERYNTTVDAIMQLNGISPPYPYTIGALPEEVLNRFKTENNECIQIPYVSNGGETFRDYDDTERGKVYTQYASDETINAARNLQALQAASYSSSGGQPVKFAYGYLKPDCWISINGTRYKFPCYPESISDSNTANYNPTPILGRSEPFQSYLHSGPRSVNVKFTMHVEMCHDFNYVYDLCNNIESVCYPNYDGGVVSATKVELQVAHSICIQGIVSSVATNYYGPLISSNEDADNSSVVNPIYSMVDIDFSVTECTGKPLSQKDVASMGGFRT